MKTRSRLIAGLVFLVLAVGLVVLLTQVDLSGGDEEPTSTFPTAVGALFPDEQTEVATRIRIEDHQSGTAFEATSEDGETWEIAEAPPSADLTQPVNDDRISSALIALPGITPSRVLNGIEAMAPYGLETPHYIVTYDLTDGAERTLIIGEQAPTSSAYYVRLEEGSGVLDSVYLIPETTLGPVIGLLSEPPVIAPTPEGTGTPAG